MQKPGYLVISLDFELMWGMFDKVTTDDYGENIRGVFAALPEMLALFAERKIHATWATVGMLMYPDADELRAALPALALQPRYTDRTLSSYDYFRRAVDAKPDMTPYHFAPELVQKIIATPGQELASHTFSHYYCLEGGENGEAIFAADCTAMSRAASRFSTKLTSIVFPRNQVNTDTLRICRDAGLTCYRGTENHFLYRSRTDSGQTNPIIRALRLLDHYCNLSGHHTYPLPNSTTGGLVNLPASRFLRPYSHALASLEKRRLQRIKNSMTIAAQKGEIFHLWWHPHNFGTNRKQNFANLIELLNHFASLQRKYGMESKNMRELATLSRVATDATTLAT